MTWREKSIAVDSDNDYIFSSILGNVEVNQQGIRREELRSTEDWDRIRNTMQDSEIFYGFLPWRNVREISKKDDYLSYPHIDIHLAQEDDDADWETDRLMIFFKEDTPSDYDEVDQCFKRIKHMWNAYRQRNKLNTLEYSYEDETHRLTAPEKQAEDSDQQEDEEPAGEHEEQNGAEDGQEGSDDDDTGGNVTDIIDQAMDDPSGLMDRFGS